MFGKLSKGGAVATALALAILGVGATPALAADGDVKTYAPGDAVLTKVIDAPAGTDASDDIYVFHFAGGGTVTESGDKLYSDGVEQDNVTLKAGDTVPTIGDVKLRGVELTVTNTLTNGQTSQTVVQKSIADILTENLTENNVEFPHAGVYTYVVTEKSATTVLSDGTYINASQAEYILRIDVVNDVVNNGAELSVANVTVEQKKDDNGDTKTGKIDPTYPKQTNGVITETSDGVAPNDGELAGDSRGRNLDGFTFANEYIKGGEFVVKKLYDGKHSDRTKYSWVELTVYSAAGANPDAHGACLTYRIEGDGIDNTENSDSDGEHRKLNGIYSNISQTNDYMATFNDQGWAHIKAELKEGSLIRITGVFGPYKPEYAEEAPNGLDRRMTVSTSGLVNGMTYYVIERFPGEYVPTGYVYEGENTNVDPRDDATGMTATQKLGNSMIDETDPEQYPGYDRAKLEAGSLFVKGTASGSATTVFVVNEIDESKVSPTGILIENLPYILMVGGPLAIFAVMFVSKRRRNAAA